MTSPIRWTEVARRGGLFALAAVLLAGCGGQVYELRMEETKKYFEFIEKQNVNLGRMWQGSGFTVRPPANYEVMPGPVIKKDRAGKVIDVGPDLRQPDFLGDRQLPGLVAAWKTEYPADAQQPKAPGYIYLLSNYPLFLEKEPNKEQIDKFHGYAVGELCAGLSVPTPPAANWIEERFPRGPDYLEQKIYRSAALKPQPEINGVKYDVTVYLQETKPLQAVLITMTPQGARAPSRGHVAEVPLGERMNLAMATFSNEGKRPVRAKPGAAANPAGGAAPAAKSPF